MDEKLVAERSYREWHDWHHNKPARDRKHEEKRKQAEIELLDSATSLQDYIERREGLKTLVAEPDLPMDEMTMSDYMKMRKRGER